MFFFIYLTLVLNALSGLRKRKNKRDIKKEEEKGLKTKLYNCQHKNSHAQIPCKQ